VAVITVPENRWARVDVKSIALLPNVLAKQQAKAAGAREAWFVDREGLVTEGASTNAWIVTSDDRLVTRPATHGILRGVTRATLFDMAAELKLRIEERPFTVAEAKAAQEAFITAATTLVTPVIAIDGAPVGGGAPGPVARELRRRFHAFAERAAG
jgi:D-alanine transaminase